MRSHSTQQTYLDTFSLLVMLSVLPHKNIENTASVSLVIKRMMKVKSNIVDILPRLRAGTEPDLHTWFHISKQRPGALPVAPLFEM